MYTDYFYFDIETTSKFKDLEELHLKDPRGYKLFLDYCKRNSKKNGDLSPEVLYKEKTPVLCEFGQTVCLSYGMYDETENKFRLTTLMNDGDEALLMLNIKNVFDKLGYTKKISGYNIRYFDIPWIAKKMYKYDLVVSSNLFLHDRKPWNTPHVQDIMEIWNNGARLYPTMDEVAYDLGIDTTKNVMNGSKVHEFYWNNDLATIKTYCEADVKTSIKIAKKLVG